MGYVFLATIALSLVFGLEFASQARGVAPREPDPKNPTTPPFAGTIYIDPRIILAEDESAFESLENAGRGTRELYDRRVEDFVEVEAYLFTASFSDGLSFEVRVNPEFESEDAAREVAREYSHVMGQLPTMLRQDVDHLTINAGVKPFGGGDRDVLIHTGQSANYVDRGILVETLIHEACHTSLDPHYAEDPKWIEAQQADGRFISDYSRDHPKREDLAESFLPYLAVRYRSARISDELRQTIERTMPNRIAYFDELLRGKSIAPLSRDVKPAE